MQNLQSLGLADGGQDAQIAAFHGFLGFDSHILFRNAGRAQAGRYLANRGMATGEMTKPLLADFQRLLDLLDTPQDIPILAPDIQRKIFYRLLVGDQGVRLRQIASAGSQGHQIARAIYWLKNNYTE